MMQPQDLAHSPNNTSHPLEETNSRLLQNKQNISEMLKRRQAERGSSLWLVVLHQRTDASHIQHPLNNECIQEAIT